MAGIDHQEGQGDGGRQADQRQGMLLDQALEKLLVLQAKDGKP
jgi:hypothetical protein